MIYHITTRRAWREALARGEYRTSSLEAEGFIHCSTDTQVVPVAEKYYQGKHRLLLLMIDPLLLSSELRWEPPSGGTPPGVAVDALFPHVYGPINLDSIVKVFDLASNPDGTYNVPLFD